MSGEQKKRIDYIDFMNIYACFSVVCMHCSGSVFEYGNIESRLFLLSLFVQTLAHAAIPVFFMITGTTLLEYRKKYDTKTFFKKRFMRTVVPFVFWSLFYLLRPVWMEGTSFPTAEDFRNALLNNGATGIFWFFYTLFAIYLCIPIFSLIAKKENFRIVEYICLLSFLATAVYPVITRFCFPVYGEIVPPFVTGNMGYVFWGWLIYHENFSRRKRMGIYIAGILGALLLFFGTWYLSAEMGATDDFLMGYSSIACYPMSIAVMLFGKHIRWERVYKIIPASTVAKIASAGLGIYVVHMFWITVSERVPVLTIHPMYFTVIMPFVIYAVSFVTVLVLQKIPILKKIIP